MKQFIATQGPQIRPDEIKGSMCAWDGCEATYPGHDMPPGWAFLLSYYARQPVNNFRQIKDGDIYRDGVLCPDHVRALAQQLKNVGRLGPMPPMPAGGTA